MKTEETNLFTDTFSLNEKQEKVIKEHFNYYKTKGAFLITDKELNQGILIFLFPFFDEEDIFITYKNLMKTSKFKGQIFVETRLNVEDINENEESSDLKYFSKVKLLTSRCKINKKAEKILINAFK